MGAINFSLMPVLISWLKGLVCIYTRELCYMSRYNAQNPLRTWLISQHYWGADKDGKYSHLFFDGGKACVPDDMCGTFGNVMCNAMAKGHSQYVIEQKTDSFKLFIDLDLRLAEGALSETLMRSIIDFIKDRVDAFYLGSFELVVCTRPIAEMEKSKYKSGIHLVWPKICTDTHDAISLREGLVVHCDAKFGSAFTNAWADIIDISVYKKNGFRMIGCKKSLCDPSVYTPTWNVDGQGIWEPLTEGISKRLVGLTSIRYFGDARTANIQGEGIVGSDTEDDIIYSSSGHKGLIRVDMSGHAADLALIRKHIELVFSSKYIGATFTALHKTQDGACYFLNTNSKYCMNKKSCHCSSNVYFMIMRDGMSQRCFSPKKPQGAKVQCNKFAGCYVPLPKALLQRTGTLFEFVDPKVYIKQLFAV